MTIINTLPYVLKNKRGLYYKNTVSRKNSFTKTVDFAAGFKSIGHFKNKAGIRQRMLTKYSPETYNELSLVETKTDAVVIPCEDMAEIVRDGVQYNKFVNEHGLLLYNFCKKIPTLNYEEYSILEFIATESYYTLNIPAYKYNLPLDEYIKILKPIKKISKGYYNKQVIVILDNVKAVHSFMSYDGSFKIKMKNLNEVLSMLPDDEFYKIFPPKFSIGDI